MAGQSSWGALGSIDSTLLDFALSHGWLRYRLGTIRPRVRRLTAFPGQLPALVTVAMTTQSSNVLLLLIDLAVGW